MNIIETAEAKCRDCYKCVRSCPVKAIRIEKNRFSHDHHAEVVADYCILDGRCVLTCPQKAKKVRSDYAAARELLQAGARVIASVAPSYPAALHGVSAGQLCAALKQLGFAAVTETAVGAEIVSRRYSELISESNVPLISSACPTIVNLVEKHYPGALPYLAPVVSPMVAHGRFLKKKYPGAKVVFIGPCIAKIAEAKRPDAAGAVDAVITFQDMVQWFNEAGLDLSAMEEENTGGPAAAMGRLYPVDGGMIRTVGLKESRLASEVLCVTGLEECVEVIKYIAAGGGAGKLKLAELLACPGGCIGGPMLAGEESLYNRRELILRHAKVSAVKAPALAAAEMKQAFQVELDPLAEPTEEEINRILRESGKGSADDELNCGACGYSSCREKARAVYRGMANPEMCLSYMRKKAESKANLFLSATPNGVIVVNREGIIVEANRAAQKMFSRPGGMVGELIAAFMDPADFHRVLAEKELLETVKQHREDLITRETIFYEPREGLAMGFFQDITEAVRQKNSYQLIREETLEKAQGVIMKQMEVAQKIAGLLGETTAETKVLLTRLIKLLHEEDHPDEVSP